MDDVGEWLAGQYVEDANKTVTQKLDELGVLLKQKKKLSECGAGAGRLRIGRRPDHGFQARQQERESVAALPDQRRAVLAGKWINKRDCCSATVPFVIESLRKWRPRPTSSGRRRRLPVRCGAHRRCRWPAPASVRRTTRAGRGSSGPSGR